MVTPLPTRSRSLRPSGRRVLWLASQGLTYRQCARVMGVSVTTAARIGNEAIWAVGATNITHAVTLALLAGEIGRWEDCGTHVGYQRHRRDRDTPDPACLIAKAEHDRQARRRPKLAEVPPPGEWSWLRAGQHFRSCAVADAHQAPKVVRLLGFEPDPKYVQVVNTGTGRHGKMSIRRLHREGVTWQGRERRSGYLLMDPAELYE